MTTNHESENETKDLLLCPKCGQRTVEDRSAFIISAYKCLNPKCNYDYFDGGVEIPYDYK